MNYINQTNIFFRIAGSAELSSSARILYLALLHKNNLLAWMEQFTCTASELEGFSGLSQSALQRARKQLVDKGLVEYDKRGANRAPRYSIIELDDSKVLTILGNTSNNTSNNTPNSTPNSTPGNSANTLVKLNQTKPDKKEKKKKSSVQENLEVDFNKLWKLYPNKKGKKEAIAAYKRAIKKGTTNKEIQNGIVDLIKHTDKRFYPNGSTWFHGERWTDSYDSPEPRASKHDDQIKKARREREKFVLYKYSEVGNDLDKALPMIQAKYPEIDSKDKALRILYPERYMTAGGVENGY